MAHMGYVNKKMAASDVNDSIKAVCFPAGCATACSFDRDLLYNLGILLGEECQAENVSILLGPAVNIKRSPLCGRNFEYFSEDRICHQRWLVIIFKVFKVRVLEQV